MLAEDFELRVAAAPGTPTPRDDWLRLSIEQPGPPTRIEQMAVHDFGELAVVSFMQRATSGQGTADISIVDVWKRDGDRWVLAVRYAGPSGARGFAIPGASSEPPIPKRY